MRDDEQVPCGIRSARDRRHRHVVAQPGLGIGVRGGPPPVAPTIELRQQHPQDRRLQLVEPRVVAHVVERLLVAGAVEPERPAHLGDDVLVGRDRAAVAEAGQVL